MFDSAFGWLSDLVAWIVQFVPKWVIIPTTHGGIKWVRGSQVVTLGPGIHWYWPLVTRYEMYPTARQAHNIPAQTMETTDGKTIVVGALIVYEIRDLEKILAQTYDPDQTVKDLAAGAIHDVCSSKSWDQLKAKGLDVELRQEVRKVLDPYGARILRVTLTSLARARVYKVMQSTSTEGT